MKNTIPLSEVESSQIAGIGFDPQSQTMAVQFRRKGGLGNTYLYQNVTAEQFEAFKASESLGRHFGATFRNPEAFPCTKCEEDKDEEEQQ